MMMSVQWPNIIVRLDGLIRCLLTMEESFCCIHFDMRIVENVLQTTSCILSPFVMSVILHGYQ